MRRTMMVVLLLAVAAAAIGSGSIDEPSVGTSGRPEVLQRAADERLGVGMLAVITYSGGNFSGAAFTTTDPYWIAYDDGSVIQPAPWGGWSDTMIGHADPEQLRQLLEDFLDSPGFTRPLGDGLIRPWVHDVGTVRLDFRADDIAHSRTALSFFGSIPDVPPETAEAREAFGDTLRDLQGAALRVSPWRPSGMLVSARPSDGTGGTTETRAWPLDPAFLARLAAGGRCVTLSGVDAQELMDVTTGPYDTGDWTTPDGTYVVSTQPVLPGRPVC